MKTIVRRRKLENGLVERKAITNAIASANAKTNDNGRHSEPFQVKGYEVREPDNGQRGLDTVIIASAKKRGKEDDRSPHQRAVDAQLSGRGMEETDLRPGWENEVDDKKECWIILRKGHIDEDGVECRSLESAEKLFRLYSRTSDSKYFIYHYAPTKGQLDEERQARIEDFRFEYTPCTKAHDYWAMEKAKVLKRARKLELAHENDVVEAYAKINIQQAAKNATLGTTNVKSDCSNVEIADKNVSVDAETTNRAMAMPSYVLKSDALTRAMEKVYAPDHGISESITVAEARSMPRK